MINAPKENEMECADKRRRFFIKHSKSTNSQTLNKERQAEEE